MTLLIKIKINSLVNKDQDKVTLLIMRIKINDLIVNEDLDK